MKIGVGTVSIGKKEIKNVLAVLKSGKISAGNKVKEFEDKIAKMHGKKYGIFCNSGQSALEIALLAYKEKFPNIKKVLTPTITYISTIFAVLRTGLTPVFCDVKKETYNIDWNLATKKEYDLALPVHMFGLPTTKPRKQQHIIEDACEALFGKVGYGEIVCFSFYVAHTITTGIGGMVITDNKEMAYIMRSLVNHGRRCACSPCKASSNYLCPNAKDKFVFVRVGTSYRADEIMAAIGLAQLEKSQKIMEIRKRNGLYLYKHLKYLPLLKMPVPRNNTFMMFPIILKTGNREKLIKYLQKKNIETRKMMPITNQPIIRKIFGNIEKKYPVSAQINKQGFYIGCHQELNKTHLDYIIKTFCSYFNK